MWTGLQVINEVEHRLGWRQTKTIEGDRSTETSKLVLLLNRVLKNLNVSDTWPLLREEGTLITEAAVSESVLLDLTNGDATVTISAFDSSGFTFEEKHKNWAIQVGSSETPIYRIEEVTSPLVVELNRVWIGDTVLNTSADDDVVQMVLAMDRYALPEDFDRPTDGWTDFLSNFNVKPRGPNKFRQLRRSRGLSIEYGNPEFYTVYGLDPTRTYQMIHFHPWPEQQTMMTFEYYRVHPEIEVDSDLVLYPVQHLSVVIESMLYLANRDYEDDSRLQAALQEYLVKFNSIRGNSNVTSDRRQFTPWAGYRQARMHGLRIDYGDAFDRVDMVDLP